MSKTLPFKSDPEPLSEPETEVLSKPMRRTFTAAYKRQILEEIDSTPHGEAGKILRREGLTYNHIAIWRQQHKRNGLEPQKQGRKPVSELERKNHSLEIANAKLEKENEKLRIIVEYQKKIATLLGNDCEEPK